MKNQIYYLARNEYSNFIFNCKDNYYIVEIDGKDINEKEDFFKIMWEKFKLPMYENQTRFSWDSYLDWMRDLTWIKEDKIVLIIYNYNNFMNKEQNIKREIIDDYESCILPFWEKDVKKIVVDGKPRRFNVYLID